MRFLKLKFLLPLLTVVVLLLGILVLNLVPRFCASTIVYEKPGGLQDVVDGWWGPEHPCSWAYFGPQTITIEDVVEVDMRPRGETIADMSLLGLEEAQERVPGLIKLPSPSAIPAGFSLVGVSVRPASGPTEWEGKTYYISSATLIYWDRPVTPATRITTISESGGIIVTINNGPGHNSTEAYERWVRPVVVGLPEDEAEEMQREIDLEIAPALEKITIGYLWGNPSVITPDSIIVYDFEKQTAYRIVGNHSTDILLGILESIIRG